MNNSKGKEVTQNDERPLSNREAKTALGLTFCLSDGPIEKGDHAEVQRRHRLLRTVPSRMKDFYKGYKPKALEQKAILVTTVGEWLKDENWLTTARDSMDVYHSITHGVADQWHLEEMDRTCDSVPEGEEGDWALWEDSANEVIHTIRLVKEPSFAAKLWGEEETEEVAA